MDQGILFMLEVERRFKDKHPEPQPRSEPRPEPEKKARRVARRQPDGLLSKLLKRAERPQPCEGC